jgi:hypothetical protein
MQGKAVYIDPKWLDPVQVAMPLIVYPIVFCFHKQNMRASLQDVAMPLIEDLKSYINNKYSNYMALDMR